MTLIQRIKQIIDYEGISISAFEQKIGASDGMIRRAVKNNTDIQSKWLTLICDNYHEINIEWLIVGNGSMLKSNVENLPIAIKQPDSSLDGIPLIPIEAMAGFGQGDTQVMEYECEKYIIPAFREAEFLIQVKGSSMYPKYSSGDIVACKKLTLDTFFQWNKVYVLDTEQGALIKRIKKSDKEDHILLFSENPKYDPFDLHRSHINSIALVVGVIRLE